MEVIIFKITIFISEQVNSTFMLIVISVGIGISVGSAILLIGFIIAFIFIYKKKTSRGKMIFYDF